MKYNLASAKVKNEKGGWKCMPTDKKIELLYIRTECLQKRLEELCAFSSLQPEKAMARLGENMSCSDCIYLSYIYTHDYSFIQLCRTPPK